MEITHYCHWPGCRTPVPPKLWGCKRHWYYLPQELRNKVWDAYVPGQEIRKDPTVEYMNVMAELDKWIKANGG